VQPRQAAALGLLVSLTALTRLDLVLLAGPIGLAALRAPRRTLPAFVLGFAPLVAWETFSVVYYGVPFPNTAYAKLATGIPKDELLRQGGTYFLDSLARDPITLFVIVAGLGAALVRPGARVAGVAVLVYLVYVARIADHADAHPGFDPGPVARMQRNRRRFHERRVFDPHRGWKRREARRVDDDLVGHPAVGEHAEQRGSADLAELLRAGPTVFTVAARDHRVNRDLRPGVGLARDLVPQRVDRQPRPDHLEIGATDPRRSHPHAHPRPVRHRHVDDLHAIGGVSHRSHARSLAGNRAACCVVRPA
jgi:hypothetical protein